MRRSAWLALLLLLGAPPIAARAGDPAPAPAPAPGPAPVSPELEAKRKLELLKTRVRQWLDIRKAIVYPCPTCGGDGKISVNIGTTLHPIMERRTCPKCVRGGRIHRDKAQQAYFEFATLAWRGVESHVTETQTFLDGLPADPAQVLLRDYKIENVALIGAKNGLVSVTETQEKTLLIPAEHRWVLADDPKTRAPNWFLWHEDTDGPWGGGASPEPLAPTPGTNPSPGAPPDPTGKPDPARVDPSKPDAPKADVKDLSEDDRVRITKLFVLNGVAHAFDGGVLDGDAVVLKLHVTGPHAKDQLEEAIARDVIAAAKVGFVVADKAASIRLVFQARYRDRLGNVELHAFKTYGISREVFSKIKFENLSREEVLDLFDQNEETHRLDGLILWWKD